MIASLIIWLPLMGLMMRPSFGFVVSNAPLPRHHTTLQESSSADFLPKADTIRFLGRGPNAIVRPGVVLLAPQEEFHHFLRQAAVFIYAMGTDDYDVFVIRGVIIDHPTAFTMAEMVDSSVPDPPACFHNLLFRGGDLGGENAIMFHSDERLAELADCEMIGTTGVYTGGLDYCSSEMDVDRFKFFFNFMEFTEQELENMLQDPQADGDAWISVEAPPEIILHSDYARGEAWARLRNAVRGKS